MIFFFCIVAALSLGLIYIIKPFFYPIFWAAVLSTIFYPVYSGLLGVTRFPNISAFIAVLITLVILFIPLSLLATLIFHQSVALYDRILSGQWEINIQNIADWLQNTPAAPYVETIKNEWTTFATNTTKAVAVFLFNNIKDLTQNSIQFIFFLFVALYALFFFFRDGERLLKRLQHLSPLGDNHEIMLYRRFTSAARATLKGSFIISGIQAIIAGFLFWATGVEGAVVWSVITFIFALIPGIGAFIVWLPIGITMLLLGHLWQGVAILIVGSLLISTIDNLLRPQLVGKDIQIHPLIIFFSTLGGIFVFGVSGIIIGPILASLYLAIISIYDHSYLEELKNNR